MNTSVTHPEVAAFVAAVRRALDDLTPDEIDDLTGGLEADLDDALTDGGATSGIERFGSPADYAAELRSAAGLPPRAATGDGARRAWSRWSARSVPSWWRGWSASRGGRPSATSRSRCVRHGG